MSDAQLTPHAIGVDWSTHKSILDPYNNIGM